MVQNLFLYNELRIIGGAAAPAAPVCLAPLKIFLKAEIGNCFMFLFTATRVIRTCFKLLLTIHRHLQERNQLKYQILLTFHNFQRLI